MRYKKQLETHKIFMMNAILLLRYGMADYYYSNQWKKNTNIQEKYQWEKSFKLWNSLLSSILIATRFHMGRNILFDTKINQKF